MQPMRIKKNWINGYSSTTVPAHLTRANINHCLWWTVPPPYDRWSKNKTTRDPHTYPNPSSLEYNCQWRAGHKRQIGGNWAGTMGDSYNMVRTDDNVKKKDGSSRRTVDLQHLNAASVRQTHHTQSPFQQASSVLHHTKKTACEAWKGYPSIPIREKDRHLTTFITPCVTGTKLHPKDTLQQATHTLAGMMR